MLLQIALLSLCSINLSDFRGLSDMEPIKEIKDAIATDAAFKKSGFRKPIEIKSLKDAKKYLGKKSFEKIEKDFDFKKRKLILFAWRGSGRDMISYDVAESLPPQMHFNLKRGLTRDLRTHVKLYSLENNIKWKIVKEH